MRWLALVPVIDEHVVHHGGEFVAGRAVHRPFGRELFAGAENFFDDDEQRALGVRVEQARRARLQALQIVAGRVQSIDVIHPQPRRGPALHELEHEAVDLFEHRRVFHPQRRDLFHVE